MLNNHYSTMQYLFVADRKCVGWWISMFCKQRQHTLFFFFSLNSCSFCIPGPYAGVNEEVCYRFGVGNCVVLCEHSVWCRQKSYPRSSDWSGADQIPQLLSDHGPRVPRGGVRPTRTATGVKIWPDKRFSYKKNDTTFYVCPEPWTFLSCL